MTDPLDIVWKFAVKDEDGTILAGIDQFDETHIYVPIEELFAYVSDMSLEPSPFLAVSLALQLGMKIGGKAAAKDVLSEWTQEEGVYWGNESLLKKYGLTQQEVDPL